MLKPQGPNYEMILPPHLTGKNRNLPCKCGSGQKAKKCKNCYRGIKPVHCLSEVEFYKQVEGILGEKHEEPNDLMWGRNHLLHRYWECGGIMPNEAADYLDKLWEKDQVNRSKDHGISHLTTLLSALPFTF